MKLLKAMVTGLPAMLEQLDLLEKLYFMTSVDLHKLIDVIGLIIRHT